MERAQYQRTILLLYLTFSFFSKMCVGQKDIPNTLLLVVGRKMIERKSKPFKILRGLQKGSRVFILCFFAGNRVLCFETNLKRFHFIFRHVSGI